MNAEPEKKERGAETAAESSLKKALRSLPARFGRLLLHNWQWKLLAVFLAVCLWAGLITQDPTLTRERVFTDVPVTISGTDTLRRNGLIVLDGLGELRVRLSVDVPQREYNTVTTSNYNARIDLSRIVETGPQTLRVIATSTTTYGTVSEISPDTLEVTVDRYVTNYRVPVTINRTGEYPAGWYGATPSLDPSAVAVSGPESLVDRIARVMVDFDVSQLPAAAGLVRTAMPMYFVDANGERLESDLLEVTSAGVLLRSIVVEQTLYPTKSLSLSSLSMIEGEPANGYEVKSVAATPNVLIAAGEASALSALDTLFLDHPVDVGGASESFTAEVKVRKPSELLYLSADSVVLAVEIGPVLDTREFASVKLTYPDQSDTQQIVCDTKSVAVTLSGPQLELKALKSNALTAYVELAGLGAGVYELPVQVRVSGSDEGALASSVTPKTVTVTIAELAEKK